MTPGSLYFRIRSRFSQWMDLDSSQPDQLENRLEEQTRQLVGLGVKAKIVVDYVEAPSPDPDRSAYWIT